MVVRFSVRLRASIEKVVRLGFVWKVVSSAWGLLLAPIWRCWREIKRGRVSRTAVAISGGSQSRANVVNRGLFSTIAFKASIALL